MRRQSVELVPASLLRGVVRETAEMVDAWEIELAVAEFVEPLVAPIADEKIVGRLVAAVEKVPGSLPFLRAVAVTGLPRSAVPARVALARQLRKGQRDTPGSASVGALTLGKKAWLADDGGLIEGGYLELRRAGQRLAQTVAVTFDHEREGALKDLFLTDPGAGSKLRSTIARTAEVVDVEPAVLMARIVEALESNLRVGVGVTETARQHLALVLAAGAVGDRDRLIGTVGDLAGRGESPPPDEYGDEEADDVEARAEFVHGVLGLLASVRGDDAEIMRASETLLLFLHEEERVAPHGLTIDRLRTFLLEFAPWAVPTGPDASGFVDAVREVVVELGTIGVVHPPAVTGLVAELERQRKDACQALADRGAFGPAKRILVEIEEAGVDMHDEAAIARYLETRFGPSL
jgi:hypothetical protein